MSRWQVYRGGYSSESLVSQSRRREMATREARLAQFSQGVPKENRPLEILCEDQSGTYSNRNRLACSAPLSAMTLGRVVAAIPVLISNRCAVASLTG
jgi:hypothetical protein